VQFLKRIFLFALVNVLILMTLSVVFNIVSVFFGIQLADQSGLWIFYGIIGMGGALINLAISRKMAKWTMGVRVIDPNTHDTRERALVNSVHELARRAQLPAMPEVGIYESPEVNAFATGPSKSRSLVAVSTGLLERMDKDAVEGVLGHEIAHIANGDMVTMTLLQGVINTMVLIAARLIASAIAGNSDDRRGFREMMVFYALQFVLSLFGSMVVGYFSRRREFRADAGGARFAGRERMLGGLKSLRSVYGQVDDSHQSLATLKISGHPGRSIMMLMATHPPLEDRIRRLETMPL